MDGKKGRGQKKRSFSLSNFFLNRYHWGQICGPGCVGLFGCLFDHQRSVECLLSLVWAPQERACPQQDQPYCPALLLWQTWVGFVFQESKLSTFFPWCLVTRQHWQGKALGHGWRVQHVSRALFPPKSSGPNVPDCQVPHFLTNTVQTL